MSVNDGLPIENQKSSHQEIVKMVESKSNMNN